MTHDEMILADADLRPTEADLALVPRAVILVEGISDQLALEALARRRGRKLEAEGISVVPMGGATNIRRFLDVYGPQGFDMRLAGLYDAGEEGDFKRALERTGFGSDLSRSDMERFGFYACQADLEEELIRALGAAAVERVIEAQSELTSLRSLQNQPAWRGRKVEDQLRRFFGSKGNRKSRFGALLVEALDLTQVPRPLDLVLAHL
jgi:predicted ATP-dependent endonuclease of OLD family